MTTPTASRRDAFSEAGQHLPVPLGGRTPVHARLSRGFAYPLRRRWRAVLVALGSISACFGAWLAVATPEAWVFGDSAGVHVGGVTLVEQPVDRRHDERVFVGDAVLTIELRNGEPATASGVAVVNGLHSTGICRIKRIAGDLSEDCTFRIGVHSMAAHDVYGSAASAWERRYGDGSEIRLRVPAGGHVVPVPFPVGAHLD